MPETSSSNVTVKRYTVELRREVSETATVEVEVPEGKELGDLPVEWSGVEKPLRWHRELLEVGIGNITPWTDEDNPDLKGPIDYVIDENGQLQAV